MIIRTLHKSSWLIFSACMLFACGGSDPAIWQGTESKTESDKTHAGDEIPKGDNSKPVGSGDDSNTQPPTGIDDDTTNNPVDQDPNTGKTCEAGESRFGESCYRLVTGSDMSFDQAKQACGQHGGKIVSIEDDLEDEFVYGMIPDHLEVVWIGLKRTAQGVSSWTWESGAAPIYTNWANGEPNNENGVENCAVMWGPALIYPAMRAMWNDAPCESFPRDTVVCERELL